MTTATLLSDLAGITYGVSGLTTEQRYQLGAEEEFEDFTKFPLLVVESGSEEDEPLANLMSRVTFMPALTLYCENETAANMEANRDSIRNAVMNNATLRADTIEAPRVEAIDVSVSPNRKLQRMKFTLVLVFDITHT